MRPNYAAQRQLDYILKDRSVTTRKEHAMSKKKGKGKKC